MSKKFKMNVVGEISTSEKLNPENIGQKNNRSKFYKKLF